MKRIELLKPHTHAGRDYSPGNTLAVAHDGAPAELAAAALQPDQAQWLIDIGVGKDPDAAPAKAK